jgi:4-hydroxy-tetrahydrodipicolinate reductase
MKIALIGYGKMGKAIEEIALQRGHQVVLTIATKNKRDLTPENLSKADVAIEFTGPETAFENVMTCMKAGIPLICGSTGWLDQLETARAACVDHNAALLVASNFSIGVNIFFEVNKKLAELMQSHPEYNVKMEEIHHTQKRDAPSGTAITLAEQILDKIDRKSNWINQLAVDNSELSIISKRIDPAPGTHTVTYTSEIDDIEIKHTAHSRKGFAGGAVVAAEYLAGKKGIYSMSDVLGF